MLSHASLTLTSPSQSFERANMLERRFEGSDEPCWICAPTHRQSNQLVLLPTAYSMMYHVDDCPIPTTDTARHGVNGRAKLFALERSFPIRNIISHAIIRAGLFGFSRGCLFTKAHVIGALASKKPLTHLLLSIDSSPLFLNNFILGRLRSHLNTTHFNL